MGKTSSAILLALSVSSLSADVCVPFPISMTAPILVLM